METRTLLIPKSPTFPWVKSAAGKRRRPVSTGNTAAACRMISIIVPAYNEEACLEATLEALRRQNHPSFEIIVVANGCTDQTAEVARERCDRLIVLSKKS